MEHGTTAILQASEDFRSALRTMCAHAVTDLLGDMDPRTPSLLVRRLAYACATETMQWTHPEVVGDIPPPCRAHTATLVDRKLIVFGGGEGPMYYNEVYILDTVMRRWVHPTFPEGAIIPPPRRAHTSVLYKGKLWIFGGGNGSTALNDVWTLDVSGPPERMRWEQIETRGKKPTARGYHTANLIGNVMVVVGGSDGRECFSDIWCLNLGECSRNFCGEMDVLTDVSSLSATDTLLWSLVKLGENHKRLSHTATQVGSYLFIYGGHDGGSYMTDLLLFNLGGCPLPVYLVSFSLAFCVEIDPFLMNVHADLVSQCHYNMSPVRSLGGRLLLVDTMHLASPTAVYSSSVVLTVSRSSTMSTSSTSRAPRTYHKLRASALTSNKTSVQQSSAAIHSYPTFPFIGSIPSATKGPTTGRSMGFVLPSGPIAFTTALATN